MLLKEMEVIRTGWIMEMDGEVEEWLVNFDLVGRGKPRSQLAEEVFLREGRKKKWSLRRLFPMKSEGSRMMPFDLDSKA